MAIGFLKATLFRKACKIIFGLGRNQRPTCFWLLLVINQCYSRLQNHSYTFSKPHAICLRYPIKWQGFPRSLIQSSRLQRQCRLGLLRAFTLHHQSKPTKKSNMKKNLQQIIALAVLAVAIVSCKKEQLDAPPSDATTANEQATPAITSGLIAAPTYKLVKRGTDSVFYYNDGRLAKVKRLTSYTKYNYGFNTILSKSYSNSNLLEEEITYKIDVATGRVYESLHKSYSNYSGGSVVTTKTWGYEYFANGLLKKRWNKNTPNEKVVTIYNVPEYEFAGAQFYNASGVYTHSLTAFYGLAQTTLYADKLHLNPEFLGLDLYLNIFGNFSKNLVQLYVMQNNSPQQIVMKQEHRYTRNADGYPVKFERFNALTQKTAGIVDFGYQANRIMQ
jgi:hypothetical protein